MFPPLFTFSPLISDEGELHGGTQKGDRIPEDILRVGWLQQQDDDSTGGEGVPSNSGTKKKFVYVPKGFDFKSDEKMNEIYQALGLDIHPELVFKFEDTLSYMPSSETKTYDVWMEEFEQHEEDYYDTQKRQRDKFYKDRFKTLKMFPIREKERQKRDEIRNGIHAFIDSISDLNNTVFLMTKPYGGNVLSECALDRMIGNNKNTARSPKARSIGLFNASSDGRMECENLSKIVQSQKCEQTKEFLHRHSGWIEFSAFEETKEGEDRSITRIPIRDDVFKSNTIPYNHGKPPKNVTIKVDFNGTEGENSKSKDVGVKRIPGGLAKDCEHILVFSSGSRRKAFESYFCDSHATGFIACGNTNLGSVMNAIENGKPLFVIDGTGSDPTVVKHIIEKNSRNLSKRQNREILISELNRKMGKFKELLKSDRDGCMNLVDVPIISVDNNFKILKKNEKCKKDFRSPKEPEPRHLVDFLGATMLKNKIVCEELRAFQTDFRRENKKTDCKRFSIFAPLIDGHVTIKCIESDGDDDVLFVFVDMVRLQLPAPINRTYLHTLQSILRKNIDINKKAIYVIKSQNDTIDMRKAISEAMSTAPGQSSEIGDLDRDLEAMNECKRLMDEGAKAGQFYRWLARFFQLIVQILIFLTTVLTIFKVQCDGTHLCLGDQRLIENLINAGINGTEKNGQTCFKSDPSSGGSGYSRVCDNIDGSIHYVIDISIIIMPIVAALIQKLIYSYSPKRTSDRIKLMEKRLESEMYRFKTKTREYSAFYKVKNNSSYGARQIFVSKCADIVDECKKQVEGEFSLKTYRSPWSHCCAIFYRYVKNGYRKICTFVTSILLHFKLKREIRKAHRHNPTIFLLPFDWNAFHSNHTEWRNERIFQLILAISLQKIYEVDFESQQKIKEEIPKQILNYDEIRCLRDKMTKWRENGLTEYEELKFDEVVESIMESHTLEFQGHHTILLTFEDYKRERLIPQYCLFEDRLRRAIFMRNMFQLSILLFTSISTILASIPVNGEAQKLSYLVPVSLAFAALLSNLLTFFQYETSAPILHTECSGKLKEILLETNSPSDLDRDLLSQLTNVVNKTEEAILSYYFFLVEDGLENGKEGTNQQSENKIREEAKEVQQQSLVTT